MLHQLTTESFQPYLNQTFRVDLMPATQLDLVLTECTAIGHEGRGRQQFQVVFVGPMQPQLPQRIYRLLHPEMGELDIFLVPIGPNETGMRYQAVFT
jgi:hypothetical protein